VIKQDRLPFDSQDSVMQGDSILEDSESKMYD